MNKSKTLTIDTGSDKHLKIKLERETEFLNVLSLNISTTDIYQNFNSDYGVLIGRVNGNENVVIPNAKISIFIPLSSTDALDENIKSIYPYTTPSQKNTNGKKYNLLPHVAKKDPITGFIRPRQPFGSFPIKEEFSINDNLMTVYKKYYKYTAVTNDSGDYMIFGVPIGTQTVHMSVDITDIGKYSMTPASMVTNMGYSPNLFTNNGTLIKSKTDLNDLPNIETQEISVNVVPLWGDTTNYVIGITRQDFRIKAQIINTVTIFGSVFTDGEQSMWAWDFLGAAKIMELYRIKTDNVGSDDGARENVGIASKRNAKITEKIYYYPSVYSDAYISGTTSNPVTEMLLLDKTEYSRYFDEAKGSFVFIINCNRKKVITDKEGITIQVPDSNIGGIFTEFRGFITFEIDDTDAPINAETNLGNYTRVRGFRYKLKVPQKADRNQSFDWPVGGVEDPNTIAWRKQDQVFIGGKYYSVAKFHGMVSNTDTQDADQHMDNGFLDNDRINNGTWVGHDNYDMYLSNTAIIQTDTMTSVDPIVDNSSYQFPSNIVGIDDGHYYFGGNWLNFALHLPQIGYCYQGFSHLITDDGHYIRSNTNFSKRFDQSYYYLDNEQDIAAGEKNTQGFARSDFHYTAFIEINKNDLVPFYNMSQKGFKLSEVTGATITSEYKYGASAGYTYIGGGCNINSDPASTPDPNAYFFKGLGKSDCFKLLNTIGII